MKKLHKIGLVVLILMMILCVVLVACDNTPAHEHNYSQVGKDENNHWNECPDDQVKDESSIAPHSYKWESDANQHWKVCSACGYIVENSRANHVDSDENGKCDDCNRIVEIPTKSGSISGTISLKKQGVIKQSGEDVSIVIKQDSETITPEDLVINNDGTFSFSAIEGDYVLQIQKEGYVRVQENITLAESNPIENKAITLEYNLMSVATVPGCDGQYLEVDHQNDENAYVSFNCKETGKTFNVMTVDAYDKASFTYLAKRDHKDKDKPGSRVGVMVQFYNSADGKTDFVWWNVKTDGSEDKIEWHKDELWTDWTNFRSLSTSWSTNVMTAEESEQFDDGTLEIGIARYENMIFGLVNGKIRETIVLDEKYADMDAHFAIIGQDVMSSNGDNKFYFEIKEDISELLADEKTFTLTVPTAEHCDITASRTSGYAKQGFELTFSPKDGYALGSIKVGETEMIGNVKNNKLQITNYNNEDIVVTMLPPIEISMSVSAIDVTQLTFANSINSYSFNVVDGKVVGSIGVGKYTVTPNNSDYISTVIEISKSNKNGELPIVRRTFDEYSLMHYGFQTWGDHCTEVYNAELGRVEITNMTDWVFNMSLEEFDGAVAFSQYFKSNGGDAVGPQIAFEDKSYVGLNVSSSGSIEWNNNTQWLVDYTGYTNITPTVWNNFGANQWSILNEKGEEVFRNGGDLTEEEKEMFNAGTLKITVVRKANYVYAFVNNRFISVRVLDEKYADMKVSAIVMNNSKYGAKTYFDIETKDDAIAKYTALCEGDSGFKYNVVGDNLTVNGNIEGYKVGDLAIIEIKANEGFVIKSIKVDGEELKNSTSVTRFVLSKEASEVKVEVETDYMNKLALTLKVEQDDISQVTFKGNAGTFNGNVVDHKLEIEIPAGEYTVTADDSSYAQTIVTLVDGQLPENLVFVKKTFNDITIVGWTDSITQVYNMTTQQGEIHADGTVIHATQEEYDQVAFTTYLKKSNAREYSGAFVKFGNQYFRVNIKHDSSVLGAIEWCCDTWMNNDSAKNVTESSWDGFGPNSWWFFDEKGSGAYNYDNGSKTNIFLSDEELAMFENGTLKLTLVRNGKTVYVFINDRCIGLRSNDDLQNSKVTVGAVNWGTNSGAVIKYDIETDISQYLATLGKESSFKFEITSNNENYDIVDGKAEGYHFGDYALIGFNAKAGYVITGMKVDGEEVSISTIVKRWVNSATLANVKIELTIASADESPELVQDIIGDANVGDASKLDFSTKGTIKILDTTDLFAATANRYGNGAISVTFKKGLTSGDVMGIGYAFGTGNMGAAGLNKPIDYNSVSFRIENNGDTSKVQWVGNWDFGLQPVHWTWDVDSNVAGYNPLNAELYNAYATGDGITITLVRQDNVFYALVNGVIVSTEYISGYEGYLGRFYVLAHGAQKDQTVSYTLLDAEAAKKLVADAQTVISGDAETKVSSFIGSVSYDEGKVKFDGSGIVSVGEGSLNESLTMNVGTKYAESDASAQMGIMYRFADGRFVYVRSEKTGDNAFKIQYSQDSVLNRAGDAYLKGWTDYQQEDEDVINAFFSDSVAITLVRNGNVITIKCGETVLNTLTLDEKYAEMDGQMMVEVDRGNNTAVEFTYENIANASVGE